MYTLWQLLVPNLPERDAIILDDGGLSVVIFSFRSRKFVTPLLGNLRNFGVFISAELRVSLNKFNTYFLRSMERKKVT